MARALLLAVLLLAAGTAWTKEASPAADDPQLERRVLAVAAELRCLVCQNQTIADSDADLAKDFRAQIREKLRKGESEQDIVRYMTARYGDFVLWRPPFKGSTLLLWIGPLLLVAAALLWLFRRLVAQREERDVALSEAEHARAARLLEPEGEKR
ncbi:MAG TPA: cytochrome c-type biogenesis protein [Burkholderiales bacterium]|nr:cytochrome c-type biogenesis protein [Burkholderiales bacterium]